MHGNVWQWCEDWFGPYDDLETRDPCRTTQGSAKERVTRGGSWTSPPRSCRAAFRNRYLPEGRTSYHGFRVVCLAGP
jgi:formylglycine-generating enzyme required for sulfatase activity